jgi:hypothetical protein
MARYQVLRGVVHHPGGIAAPGETITLDPAEGDPLCVGRDAVLAALPEPVTEPAIEPVAPAVETTTARRRRRVV